MLMNGELNGPVLGHLSVPDEVEEETLKQGEASQVEIEALEQEEPAVLEVADPINFDTESYNFGDSEEVVAHLDTDENLLEAEKLK